MELGAGSSERWIASAEASSIRRERRVETECRRKVTKTRVTIRKMMCARRMTVAGVSTGELYTAGVEVDGRTALCVGAEGLWIMSVSVRAVASCR